ncbi:MULTISPECIES: hypothetical protein [unclassified Microbacterium]|uniref:hypothetical protein n=1 Tax=unclassified Microbacterium TaxID=2609290 RepID=UPI0030104325
MMEPVGASARGGCGEATNGEAGVALREFYQAERDEELGRWRWPENPDYVVYPVIQAAHEIAFGQELSVMVFHEPTGVLKGYCRAEDQGGDLTREYPGAARAYFDAHPERNPWEGAKEGEVWAITVEHAAVRAEYDGMIAVTVDRGDFVATTGLMRIDLHDSQITAARRIWPESD